MPPLKRRTESTTELPTDVVDAIWTHVRRVIHPGLKRRQCDALRDELMRKWFEMVFKPHVRRRLPLLVDRCPEAEFLDSWDEALRPILVICLFKHWNIERPQRFAYDEMLRFDPCCFADAEWEALVLRVGHHVNWNWPNAVRDMREVMD